MLEYELDIVQRSLDAGDEVIWLMCEGNAPFCPANPSMKKRICMECKSRTRSGLRWLEHRERLTISSLYDLDETQLADTQSWVASTEVHERKLAPGVPSDLAGTDWYEAAYSTLQTTYKEFRPDLFKNKLLFVSLVLDFFQSYLAFQNNLARFKPDVVWIFNGRITRFRPALRICQRESKKSFVYEYPYQGFKRYLVIEGQYPHDFGNRSIAWKKSFDNYPLSVDKKLAIGDAWYQKRLARIQTSYEKVFSEWQTRDLLPPDWNSSRCNVTIFNSSEWESAGVPESKRWNYKDQYSAIERIAQDTQHLANLHFTFRIHPQMAKKDKESAAHFLTLNRFSNVTVLSPESKYDTYALAMAADMVLTFYSLIGVESAWLGQKVVCIGPSSYQDFGCVYLPRTHEELVDVFSHPELAEKHFPSKDMRKRGAQEFAFARIFSGTKSRYLVKNHYTRAQMRRRGVTTKIRATLTLRIFNRLISLPYYLVEALQRVYSDEFLRKEITANPWKALKRFLYDRIGGVIP